MSFDPQHQSCPETPSTSLVVAPEPALRSIRPLTGETKRCSHCGAVKDLAEFAHKLGRRAAHCRACQKTKSDEAYHRNKAKRLEQVAARKANLKPALLTARDAFYETHGVCHHCLSTTELMLTSKQSYTGISAREALHSWASAEALEEALQGSIVLCKHCMSSAEIRELATSN